MRRSPAIALSAMIVVAMTAVCTLSGVDREGAPMSASIVPCVLTDAPAPSSTGDETPQNSAQPTEQKRRGKQGPGERPAKAPLNQPGLLQQMTGFKTDVPAHELDVILVRPTDRSIEITIAAWIDASGIVEYWRDGAADRKKTSPVALKPGEIAHVTLNGLAPGAEYRYRVGIARRDNQADTVWKDESRFRTRPAPGTPFTFTIQADSHLDQSVEPRIYEQTLANMLAAKPDLVIDLGDTFMTDKRGRDFKSTIPQYDAQRWYFGLLAHSAPLFMVLGNHDGEKGTSGTDVDDIGPWSYLQRTRRFPEPIIDNRMYTGATGIKNAVGANYYAFQWGDALFIVLDPFWSSTQKMRGGGTRPDQQAHTEKIATPTDASWAMTLGRAQYDWLARTLDSTNAKHRFVFIHHLVGGLGGNEARGGVEASGYFEWGGKNADATPGFAQHRAGWPMPIHDLLAMHHVSAVFHGHDHLYVHNQRDAVQYQCVPQPGNPPSGTRSAAEYGYEDGKIMGSPGHVRVRVTPQAATVEFIRTVVDGASPRRGRDAETSEANASIVDSYTIEAAPSPTTGNRP
ncbi:MAG: metallophosphoesterase [Phycisphaerales bacterium]|nr:metallophosphoesterase [Phycisphaerales bacterium]